MERESMIFYREWLDALEEDVSSEDERLRALYCILLYGLYGRQAVVNKGGAARAIYRLAVKTIDANNRKYEAGKKGGRPRTRSDAKKD